jgi:hypothetical protein
MAISQDQFNRLKKRLNNEQLIPVGAIAKGATVSTISSRPATFIPELLFFLKGNKIYSATMNSGSVSNALELNTGVANLRELRDSLTELERGQETLEKIASNYTEASQLTDDDIVNLKMLDFSLGTLKSICQGLQEEKRRAGKYQDAKLWDATISGVSFFRQALKPNIQEQARTMM